MRIRFKTSGKVKAAGNSNTAESYAYTDVNVAALNKVQNYITRIQETDK
jgi:hypothetical protein